MMKLQYTFLYVYIITNIISNKQYVGSKVCYKNDPHYDNYMGSSKYLNEDINKIGEQNFKKEIIKFCNNKKELLDSETYFIIKLHA